MRTMMAVMMATWMTWAADSKAKARESQGLLKEDDEVRLKMWEKKGGGSRRRLLPLAHLRTCPHHQQAWPDEGLPVTMEGGEEKKEYLHRHWQEYRQEGWRTACQGKEWPKRRE